MKPWKSLKHAHKVPGSPVTDPVYKLTKSELEAMLTQELRNRIKDEGWVRIDDARSRITKDLVESTNAGIKMVLIVLMENHLMGISRIEKNILRQVNELDAEWTRDIVEHSEDYDVALGRLELRFEQACRDTRRAIKDAGPSVDSYLREDM